MKNAWILRSDIQNNRVRGGISVRRIWKIETFRSKTRKTLQERNFCRCYVVRARYAALTGKKGKAVEILPRVLARTSSEENVQAI